mmetsp:Transcript_37789/g.84274  ORF Transcript_37789/g.84274 Transcript_37789/m.84274 type:complete len:982 (+) Transcript_37789:122-3067(+)|eukprot:CAMPEP_0202897812 /NCGR_PEP_ID=MMETSP1392-20130828/6491_1 /ASSEMBLY_ACC=CAM_ASM_000868 /TAXON_ID=225041 /ORGANISM="Chlamydomonas chlamydogama, Strain SAG 11-48b" /LENGTH=981 /DNA_ID=CAMNT_0049583561 /DNA_START=45 /DNA_END=2990 /DNA_ORIENTATION=+
MAPKKAEAPAAPPVDTNPFGAFINVRVEACSLFLDGEAPQSHLVLAYHSDWAPIAGNPATCGEDGLYHFNFQKSFRREPTPEALIQLINSSVKLMVHSSAANAPIASAELDMLPLALGEQSWQLESLPLQPTAGSQVISGQLRGISVALMLRAAPEGYVPPAAPTTAASRPSSALPDAAAAAAAAAATAAASQDPVPWQYVSTEEAEGCNVIELAVKGCSPLPPGLQTADSAAKEGKNPGRLGVTLGLSLPEGPQVLDSSGAVQAEGGLVFGARVRVRMSAKQCQALLYHLEDGLPLAVEVARYVHHEQLFDPAWEHYHAAASLQAGSQLLQAGAAYFEEQVELSGFTGSSFLPAYTPPAGKPKPVEEAPAAGAPNPWQQAGTRVSLAVTLARPLMPAWQPPPQPAVPLTQLVNSHPGLKPYKQPTDATDAFRKMVGDMLVALRGMALEGAVAAGTGGRQGVVTSAKALAAELHLTGKYMEMRHALKHAAAAVAREQFSKARDAGVGDQPDAPSRTDKVRMHAELFAHLAGQVNTAAAVQLPTSSADQTKADAQRLAKLAAECELQGQLARAEVLHQHRIVLLGSEAAPAWQEYGAMCARAGRLGRAEECLRRFRDDSEQVTAQASLAALLLHRGRYEDELHLEEAEAVAKQVAGPLLQGAGEGGVPASDAGPGARLGWPLLVLLHAAQGDQKHAAHIAAVACVTDLERHDMELGLPPSEANPYFALAGFLLNLGLPALALEALERVTSLDTSAAALKFEVSLGIAKAQSMMGPEHSKVAQEQLKAAALLAPPGGVQVESLLGDIQHKAGRHADAVHAYRAAVAKDPSACSLQLFLNLAAAYLNLRHVDYAMDIYTQACAHTPCAAAWLGLGATHLAQDELPAAELAVAEASRLDPENPNVWATQALIQLKSGRRDEAGTALKGALRFGAPDAMLLEQLAQEYGRLVDLGTMDGGESAVMSGASRLVDNLMVLLQGQKVPA